MAHRISLSLPQELLQHIFEEMAILGKEINYNYDDTYLLINSESLRVSHVCRLWRTVALNTPRLWVDIRLPIGESVPKLAELWKIIVSRAKKHPLRVDIIEGPEERLRLLKQMRLKAFSEIISAATPMQVGELRCITFEEDPTPFIISFFSFTKVSSLTVHREPTAPGRKIASITTDIFTCDPYVPSVQLSLVGVNLKTIGVTGGVLSTLKLRHLVIRYCTVLQRGALYILILSCPHLESCVFRNNVYREARFPPPPRYPPTTFPGTIRLIEIDDSINSEFLSSGQRVGIFPHLTTCGIDFDWAHLRDFLQTNPNIVTLSIYSGADITDIGHVAPQVRELQVHDPEHALLLCKENGSADSLLFPHLKELHIYLSDPVSFDCLEQLMRPVDGFTQPLGEDDSSQLERLILIWNRSAYTLEELKPQCQWLEDRGYWDRVVVTRGEEEWRFSWTRAASSS
jgi:hypothetical protein